VGAGAAVHQRQQLGGVPADQYEWQIPAVANAAANAGLHMFVTCSVANSSTFTSDIICSY